MEITLFIASNSLEKCILDTPSLETMLARGKDLGLAELDPDESWLDRFKCILSETEDLPVASMTALVDLENSEGKTWLRADPVFLHADLNSLILFDSQKFSLTEEDVVGFFSIINPLLEEDGLRLCCGDVFSRWYLKLENDLSIRTTPPGVANGHDIHQFLPTGEGRDYWIRLGNEIQMLLHESSVNTERQKRGEVPINSVWFWGSGKLAEKGRCRFDRIISDDINAHGMAAWADVRYEDIPTDFNHWISSKTQSQRILMVLSQGDMALSNSDQQHKWLVDMEKRVFQPVLSSLKKGEITNLEIFNGDCHRKIKRHHLLRFWRTK